QAARLARVDVGGAREAPLGRACGGDPLRRAGARSCAARRGGLARDSLAGVRLGLGPTRVRAAPVQSSALYPLLVRYHGRPEVHRARRPGAAPPAYERAPAAHGPEAQRPAVLDR